MKINLHKGKKCNKTNIKVSGTVYIFRRYYLFFSKNIMLCDALPCFFFLYKKTKGKIILLFYE